MPKITHKVIKDVFEALSIDTEVLDAREFSHKIYLDCSKRVTKPQFTRICRYLEDMFEDTQFFLRYDVANESEYSTVFLGNVVGLTAADLADEIERRLGFVPKTVRIPVDKRTEKPKSIAYVSCDTREQAEELAESLKGVKLGASYGLRTDLLVHSGDNRITLRPRKQSCDAKPKPRW